MTIFEVALHQNDRQAASTRITPAVAATGSEWDHAPALDVPSVEHWLAVSRRARRGTDLPDRAPRAEPANRPVGLASEGVDNRGPGGTTSEPLDILGSGR